MIRLVNLHQMKKILSNIYNFIKSLFKPPKPPELPATLFLKSHAVYRVAAEKFEPTFVTDQYTSNNTVNDSVTNTLAHELEVLKKLEYKVNVLDHKIKTFKEKPIIEVNKISREEALKLSGLQCSRKEIGTHFNITQANVTNILKKRE